MAQREWILVKDTIRKRILGCQYRICTIHEAILRLKYVQNTKKKQNLIDHFHDLKIEIDYWWLSFCDRWIQWSNNDFQCRMFRWSNWRMVWCCRYEYLSFGIISLCSFRSWYRSKFDNLRSSTTESSLFSANCWHTFICCRCTNYNSR